MKTTFKHTLLGIMGMSLLLFTSCNDEVSVENTNELSVDTFFENLSQIEAAANGAYAQLQNAGLYQRYGYILPDTFSDEMQPGTDPNFVPSYRFILTPDLLQVQSYWTTCYNGIGACNFVLANEGRMRDNSAGANFTNEDIDDVLGQALFLRGLYYYLLVKRFGGVPLNIEDVGTPQELPRSTVTEVYASIIDDFTKASQLLYDKGATENGRATRGAALGMLGKVYLHREMYTEAQQTLAMISGYSLLPLEEYNDNFNESGEYNDESMFEVSFSGDLEESDLWSQTGIGVSEVTFHAQEYTAWGNLKPSQKLLDEYEDDDPRLAASVLINGDSYGPGNAFTFTAQDKAWYKFSQLYENEEVQQNGDTNARILRYADVVLMRAEVEHKLGNDTQAISFLNEIRERVEMPLYGTPEMDAIGYAVDTPQGVFNAIVHERMIELVAEQHRYDDLVRWNLDAQELSLDFNGDPRNYNPDVHRLMPIPQSEIDTNDNIGPEDQNPGY